MWTCIRGRPLAVVRPSRLRLACRRVPWTLDSAEQRAAEAPRSFFIPPPGVRHALKVGDTVKLIFRLQRDDGETAVERMWVEVVQTEPYAGLLRNTPQLGGVIAFGDRVTFAAEHVCGYAYNPRRFGYDPDAECFLLKRVARAEGPPALLVLNDDGSWEAHAGDEADEELADSSNVLHWTVGYLADRFPQTEQALRDGSALQRNAARREPHVWWNWDHGEYVRRGP